MSEHGSGPRTSDAVARGSGGAEAPEQFRAYWAAAFDEGMHDESEVAALISDATATNHNAVIAQVVRRADFLGDDPDVPPPRTDSGVADGFDPLAALVAAAHDAGIEAHAWMNVNTLWTRAAPPSADDHVRNTHGPDSDDPWTSVRADGAVHDDHTYFFDLGHPGGRDYIVRTARRIVERYDVDGLNLDFVRYPTPDGPNQPWGYNPVAVERFQDATGRDDVPEPGDEGWTRWRREQVTGLVRRIYLACFDVDPSVRISADTVARWTPPQRLAGWEETGAYARVLQDWRGWMDEGIIDLNVPMNYRREVSPDAEQYREWSAFVADTQYDRHAVVGSGLYRNEIGDSVDQIRAALTESDAGNAVVGWTGFSYGTPDVLAAYGVRTGAASREAFARTVIEPSEHDPGTTTGERDPVFASPARVPGMDWKTDPETGHLQGTVTAPDGHPVDDSSVAVFDGGTPIAETVTTGNGWFGVVDLDPGTYRVAVRAGAGAGRRELPVAVEVGELATVTVDDVDAA